MDQHVRGIYLREARAQCHFALNAVRALNNVLPRLDEAHKAGNAELAETLHREVFRSIHSLLTHASNVSKLFWPTALRRKSGESDSDLAGRYDKSPRHRRATELRRTLKLPSQGHALESRELRNHLEHFDERLDDWSVSSTRRNFIQDSIGDRRSVVGIDDCDVMRWYDPGTHLMIFRGRSFDLQALVVGLKDVLAKVEHVST